MPQGVPHGGYWTGGPLRPGCRPHRRGRGGHRALRGLRPGGHLRHLRGRLRIRGALHDDERHPVVDAAKCNGCGECERICPANVLTSFGAAIAGASTS
ncbi:MAG: 4Fe-4S binding protein [Adlercreutzia equolifaciens]